MAYVVQKAAEEVTERALVPYVVQPIVESGFSTMLVKWLPTKTAMPPKLKCY